MWGWGWGWGDEPKSGSDDVNGDFFHEIFKTELSAESAKKALLCGWKVHSR